MKIIAHRGYWKESEEKNTMVALKRAIDCGYGVETDIRDCSLQLLISHNPPKGNEPSIEDFFQVYQSANSQAPLALNIKADGLQELLTPMLNQYGIRNYFFFDMSVCDTVPYLQMGMTVASRISEYEPTMPFYESTPYVWVDYFERMDCIATTVDRVLRDEKIPCIVSPELHGHSHHDAWKLLLPLSQHNNILLCTDFPADADQFFNNN